MHTHSAVHPIIWANSHLHLLDQRILPHKQEYCAIKTTKACAQAIRDMVVRGAPAIGITAAYGMVLAAQAGENLTRAEKLLAESRPTAINLHAALTALRPIWAGQTQGSDALAEQLLESAINLHQNDLQMNLRMGELGSQFLCTKIQALKNKKQLNVLTHCNTGGLATGGYGTALGVIRSLSDIDALAQVYAGETRPWLQGARLTAWELAQDGLSPCLIADGAAAFLMAQGKVDAIIVGADRITANGDVANKIGTYSLAVLAKQHEVLFMVVAPSTTFDLSLASGTEIPIETRDGAELRCLLETPTAPEDCLVWNPVFDVTPAHLIDVIICEKGVISPVVEANVRRILGEK